MLSSHLTPVVTFVIASAAHRSASLCKTYVSGVRCARAAQRTYMPRRRANDLVPINTNPSHKTNLHEESGRIVQRVRTDWRPACDSIPAPCASPCFSPAEIALPIVPSLRCDACCLSRHDVELSPLNPCVRGSLAISALTASASSTAKRPHGMQARVSLRASDAEREHWCLFSLFPRPSPSSRRTRE